MAAFLDLCRFVPTAAGTTDWTYSSAVGGCQSPAAANAANGMVYKFLAISNDLTQWEIAEGAYNSAGAGALARTTVLYNSSGTGTKTPGQSGAGTKINFSTVPQVAIIGVKEDLISVEENNGFSSGQKNQARKNIGASGVVRFQKFVSSGTYTPDPNLLYAIIECVGGGGGGGGVAGSATFMLGAPGGASGGHSRKIASAATIGASQTVTIGAGGSGATAGNNSGGSGGATSVGALCTANGGAGGGGMSSVAASAGATGGAAGIGDLAIPGQNTTDGMYFAFGATGVGGAAAGGNGGNTPFGAGGIGGFDNNGNAGTGIGSGGGGAGSNAAGNFAGAAGQAGIVFITEFCWQ